MYLNCSIHFIEERLVGKYFTWIINQSLSHPSTIIIQYMKKFLCEGKQWTLLILHGALQERL